MSPSHVPNVLDRYGPGFMSRERRAEVALGLRQLADWIERSEFPIPTTADPGASWANPALDVFSTWFPESEQDFIARPGAAARLIGGRVDKTVADSPFSSAGGYFELTRSFAGGVRFRFNIARNAVCEAVEKVVEKSVEVFTDEQRAEQLQSELEALKTTETRSVTVLEYECPESLLAALQPEAR